MNSGGVKYRRRNEADGVTRETEGGDNGGNQAGETAMAYSNVTSSAWRK